MSIDNVTLRDTTAFRELDVESITQYTAKQGKPTFSASLRRHYTYAKRWAFSTYVASKKTVAAHSETDGPSTWHCCGEIFEDSGSVHKHVSRTHNAEVLKNAETILQLILSGAENDSPAPESWRGEAPVDVSTWIPDTANVNEEHLVTGQGEVLLFYCYTQLPDPQLICNWQKVLCQKLHLTGKVRVAVEGINGTVGGTKVATGLYIQAMLSHPVFMIMVQDDFKSSEGGSDCFTDLKVGLYKEMVPMGVDPDAVSFRQAGVHLGPEEFHREVEILLSRGDLCNDTILLDCRNFYESKIGQFSKCLAPDIRKFSYFPDYVDKNLELFRDKKVLMYCTGGIRCERGSAYLRSKDVCKEVYQLKGGIHKYLERYPDGFYRGKLFVFDERYAISFNSDIISDCRYCGSPWDQYRLCSTRLCCQLVLSCPSCRERGCSACCPTCQRKEGTPGGDSPPPQKEECECTDTRPRIPQDVF